MNTANSAIRHIVVATDFEPPSTEAVRRAAALATRLGATMSLLHVVEPLPMVSAWGDPGAAAWIGMDALLQAGGARLRRQAEVLGDVAASAALVCRVGMPRRDLGTIAAELGGDLLVIGCRGERRLGDRLLGSTAQTTLHRAAIPVLVVRRPAATSWDAVLAASDFSPASLRAIALAEALAPAASKRLLHVHAPMPEATLALMQPDPGQLETYLGLAERDAAARFEQECATYPAWKGEFRRGPAIDTVLGEAERHAVPLLALGTRGHGPWLGGLLGSLGQAALARGRADVLLVPDAR